MAKGEERSVAAGPVSVVTKLRKVHFVAKMQRPGRMEADTLYATEAQGDNLAWHRELGVIEWRRSQGGVEAPTRWVPLAAVMSMEES